MIIDVDPVKQIEEQILEEIIKGNYKPHQKLLSERKLAEKFNTTPARVHRALQNLVKKGYLYTKIGHGTFVKGKHPEESAKVDYSVSPFNIHLPHLPVYKKIKVAIPIGDEPHQVKMWRKVLNAFRKEHPFIDLEVNFAAMENKGYDLIFLGPYQLRLQYKELFPLEELLEKNGIKEEELCKDILKLGKVEGILLGIPILRNPAIVSVNNDLLEKYGLKAEEIKKPGDLLRIGDIVEKKSRGEVMGTRYLGFIYHGAMYGIDIKREEKKVIFDKERVRKFLEETKPYIKRHHFKSHHETGERLFLEGRYAIYPHFYAIYQLEKESKFRLSPIPFPLEKGGFGCEGMLMGCVPRESRHREEAILLLRFLVSKEGQRIFVGDSPNWLSVRKDVLEEQRKNSPFPEGALLYDFDLRSYYSQVDPVIFKEYATKLNTEAGKFFTGLQGIEETLEKLEYI